METSVLKELGLNDNEIQIYLLLIQKGPLTASTIAELTKLHRTHVYDLLESLTNKAVVAYIIKENKKYFQPVEPKKLDVLLERKQEQLNEDTEKLRKLISDLSSISTTLPKKLIASVYQGKQGFQSQLNDILKTLEKNEEYLVLGFTQKSDDTLKYFLPGFSKRRIKAKIRRRAIMDLDLRDTPTAKQPLQEVKFLPKDLSIPMGIIIYANKVILVIIEEDYISIVIENQKISDNFRNYFELIWKTAKH